MSRQIVLDTETTGLSADNGDRIIELGCVELLNRKLTGHDLHLYFNPDRDSHEDALKVHGLTTEFLSDKPRFGALANDIVAYLSGAELIIHNAPFDVGFLNAELARLDMAPIDTVCHAVEDSLRLAKELHPGKKNNLDALCERYGIDNSHRTLHGALLDAEILAEVYVAMTRGQESLDMEPVSEPSAIADMARQAIAGGRSATRRILRASAGELAEHEKLLAAIQQESKGKCLWLAAEEPAAQ